MDAHNLTHECPVMNRNSHNDVLAFCSHDDAASRHYCQYQLLYSPLRTYKLEFVYAVHFIQLQLSFGHYCKAASQDERFIPVKTLWHLVFWLQDMEANQRGILKGTIATNFGAPALGAFLREMPSRYGPPQDRAASQLASQARSSHAQAFCRIGDALNLLDAWLHQLADFVDNKTNHVIPNGHNECMISERLVHGELCSFAWSLHCILGRCH